MARSLLVIEFCRDAVRAGVFKAGKTEPVEFLEAPRGEGAAVELKALMDEIRRRGLKGGMRTFVALDPALVSLRVVTLPFSDKDKLDEVIGFEAQDIFLKNVEELALASLPLGSGRAVAAAVEKTVLREHLAAFKEAGIDPEWIGLSMLSKDRVLREALGGEGSGAFLDAESLTVVKDGGPFLYKRITDVDDLRLSLAALEEEGVDIGRFYAADKAAALLDTLGVPCETAGKYSGGRAGVIAVAMHVGEGFKDGVNFRAGEFADTGGIEAAKRGFKTEIVLLAVLLIVWGGYAYLKNRYLDSSLKRLNSVIEGSYRELFPGETGATDFSYRLEAKLKALRDEKKITGNGVDVASALRRISLAAGKEGSVRIYQARIFQDKITAGGETSSFDGANRFRDSMSRLKYFKEITLTDVKSSAAGGVNFNITAVIKDAP
ncbi:MAG: hypothetical protein HZB22_06590 [Deltaproteobacteria bacterium]|nr:hypothetical protein [Deltaproteobacteria bacterium]